MRWVHLDTPVLRMWWRWSVRAIHIPVALFLCPSYLLMKSASGDLCACVCVCVCVCVCERERERERERMSQDGTCTCTYSLISRIEQVNILIIVATQQFWEETEEKYVISEVQCNRTGGTCSRGNSTIHKI